jgi:hypothetical protein
MFLIPLCFISLNVSWPFIFYLSTCFRSPHILFFDMFQIPPYFISLRVSVP